MSIFWYIGAGLLYLVYLVLTLAFVAAAVYFGAELAHLGWNRIH